MNRWLEILIGYYYNSRVGLDEANFFVVINAVASATVLNVQRHANPESIFKLIVDGKSGDSICSKIIEETSSRLNGL